MFAELILTATLLQTATQKNPTAIEFSCTDHQVDDRHELSIRLAGTTTDGTLVNIGDPPARTDGKVEVEIGQYVKGLNIAKYELRVRNFSKTIASEWSNVVPFERALLPPDSLVIIR